MAEAHLDPDRWQAALPEPFKMLDEILQDIIDDVLVQAHVREHAARLEHATPLADDEEGAAVLLPTTEVALPAELSNAGADSLMEAVIDGVYAFALADRSL